MLDKRYVNLSLMMKHFRLYLDGHQLRDPVQNESLHFTACKNNFALNEVTSNRRDILYD